MFCTIPRRSDSPYVGKMFLVRGDQTTLSIDTIDASLFPAPSPRNASLIVSPVDELCACSLAKGVDSVCYEEAFLRAYRQHRQELRVDLVTNVALPMQAIDSWWYHYAAPDG